MFKQIIIVLGLCFSLAACATEPKISDFSWRYGTGSNIDSFCTTKATFYHKGEIVFSYPGGGCNAGAPYKSIIDKNIIGREAGGYLPKAFLFLTKHR